MQDSITTGIVSGLLTSLILFIGAVLWAKWLSPWIENMLYRDAQIEGTWTGFLVPYIGLVEVDKFQKEHALEFMKHVSRVKRSKFKQNDKKEPIKESSNEEKSLALPQFDKEGKIVGELIMPEQPKSKGDYSTESTNVPPRKKISFSIAIQPVPIQVKVELRRTGHNVTGRVIEIGGASDICSYAIEGEFRNLILACVYETESKEDIDRGSFSLMLRNNGKSLEGFFSSYANDDHAIAPMNCVLRKQGHFDLGSEMQGGEK